MKTLLSSSSAAFRFFALVRIGFLLAACLLTTPGFSALLATSWSYAPANGNTLLINETSGTGSIIGPSGVNFLNSLARSPDGTFWSAGMVSGDLRNRLIRINPTTGVGTAGPLLNYGTIDATTTAMAYSPAGVLFAVNLNDELFTVDTSTGLGTHVGRISVPGYPIGVSALAFSPDGRLFGWGVERLGLFTIDPATAAYTDVSVLNGPGGHIQAMTFGDDGRLYAARESLFVINTQTGLPTQIGSGEGITDVRGLAVIPEPAAAHLAVLAIALSCSRRPRNLKRN